MTPSTPSDASGRRGRVRRAVAALALSSFVAALNALAWWAANPASEVVDAPTRVAGLAYSPYSRGGSPFDGRPPDPSRVDDDLARLARITDSVRTYSAAEVPALPELAARHRLRVTLGAWLDGRDASDAREIEAAIEAARHASSIQRIVVGNETQLNGSVSFARLVRDLARVRSETGLPVSTAEPWHVWLRQPELARQVDFITVHLLPYWERVPAADAVDYALHRLAQLRARFPGQPVVIGEIGWPSAGNRIDGARPDPAAQARVVREFVARARQAGIDDYFLMEAIDQPWKAAIEGRVGAHWGILDADREPKFAFAGPVDSDPRWRAKALVSILAALPLVLAFAWRFGHLRWAARLCFAAMAQACASLAIALGAAPFDDYVSLADRLAAAAAWGALAVAAAILLVHAFEFAEAFWPGSARRRFGPSPTPPVRPFVSIHVPCSGERPEVVIATLESLRALDYDAFEVIVVDNNTADPALWRPVRRHMRTLPANFRHFRLPRWPGFKAGALDFALARTDARATVIGVVDADYVVRRDWLADLVGHFADPAVALVQAPQAHRDWACDPFRRMMNWEYEGFFRIGMHHRNERNAIVQHGTMTLVRADALRAAGGWAAWCVCEDAELGLRLLERGHRSVYVDRVFGEGLTPDGFDAYRRQRRRWALGAMQILRAHWRELVLPGRLTIGQRYHFVAGWLPWLGDALHLAFVLAAMAWTVGLLAAPHWFAYPTPAFAAPLVAILAAKAVFGPLLYVRRVRCPFADVAGAALAGVGLSHAIASGVWAGLLRGVGVFEVTRKGGDARRPAAGAVREEAALLLGLGACAIGLAIVRPAAHVESATWILALALLAIPYVAALACDLIARRSTRTLAAPARAPIAARTDS